MKLKNAAKYFDRTIFADAYDLLRTFQGQFDVFDDSKRDGLTIERRIISVGPDVVVPARRTVVADGVTWMFGDAARDYFKGESIRHKYVAHQATELVSVKTLAQALAGSAGLQAWASRVWIKAAKEVESSSDVTDVFDIYFSPTEAVPEGSLILMAGRWHIVRSLYQSAGGLLVALADELPEPVVTTCTFKDRTYNPVTDSYTAADSTVPVVRIRWQSHFRYPNRGSDKYKPGDISLVFSKTVTPTTADKVTVGGISYNVLSVLDEGSTWLVHARND